MEDDGVRCVSPHPHRLMHTTAPTRASSMFRFSIRNRLKASGTIKWNRKCSLRVLRSQTAFALAMGT